VNIREKNSLCYSIGSSYHSTRGLLTVSAGIDSHMDGAVRRQILEQLDACCRGDITPQELTAAKEALRTGLQGVMDSPGAIENYFATGAISGLELTPAQEQQALEQVTVERVAAAAKTVKLHTVFFLKGVSQ